MRNPRDRSVPRRIADLRTLGTAGALATLGVVTGLAALRSPSIPASEVPTPSVSIPADAAASDTVDPDRTNASGIPQETRPGLDDDFFARPQGGVPGAGSSSGQDLGSIAPSSGGAPATSSGTS